MKHHYLDFKILNIIFEPDKVSKTPLDIEPIVTDSANPLTIPEDPITVDEPEELAKRDIDEAKARFQINVLFVSTTNQIMALAANKRARHINLKTILSGEIGDQLSSSHMTHHQKTF